MRLPDKTLLAASTLWLQALILIKLADFQGAKDVLRRAYNKKTPDPTDKKNIENTLKVGKFLNVSQLQQFVDNFCRCFIWTSCIT